MITINVYLTFNGNCEAAFEFYKSIFGGEISFISRFKDIPAEEGKALSKEEGAKIMHICLPISAETMLMGSDIGGDWAPNFIKGNNFSISINTDTKESADRIFNALANGGIVGMPMADTFWGDYFGMLTDKFGINWMMSFNAELHKK